MPDEGTFYAPLGYAALWPWVAAALVIGAVVALAWALLWPARTARPRPAERPRHVDPEQARREALAEIERIHADARSGSMTVRHAHIALSAVVRGFADTVGAVPATRMTLAELSAEDAGPITHGVARLYPGEFGPREFGPQGAELDAAVTAAKEAVISWR